MHQKQADSLKNLSVLVVDDNPLQAAYIQDLLADIQAHADTVSNAKDTLELLEQQKGEGYACLIIDTVMPECDGFELAQLIRSKSSAEYSMLPIIGLLTPANEQERNKAFASGMNATLLKPINPQKLYDEIHHLQQLTFVGLHGDRSALQGKKAYVISPDDDIAESLQSILQTFGITLDYFSSFNTIMDVVESVPAYDFAFVDWRTSQNVDQNLAEKLELFGQNTFHHLIVITADWSLIESNAAVLGIDAYVSLPLNELDVANVLEKVVLDDRLTNRNISEDFNGLRILIADDNTTNALVLQNAVETFGAVADIAEDGKEALAMLTNQKTGYYNLAFLDIFMPELKGFEVTERFRKLERTDAITLPIIGISGNSSIELVEQATTAGMNALMLKPINKKSLLAYMNIFLKEENYNKIFNTRISSKLKSVQDDLFHAKYKVDIISYLVNHNDMDDILSYIATHLLGTIGCDSVCFFAENGKHYEWFAEGVKVPHSCCSTCPVRDLKQDILKNHASDILVIEDVTKAHDSCIAPCCHAKSIIIKQVVLNSQVIGRLSVHFIRENHVFTDSAQNLLHIAADAIVMAIERNQNALTMRRQEHETQLIIDNSALPVAMYDKTGTILRCNHLFSDVILPFIEKGIHDHADVKFPHQSILSGDSSTSSMLLKINDQDWELHAQAIYDNANALQYVFSYASDITEITRHLQQQQVLNTCFTAMLLHHRTFNEAMSDVINAIVAYFQASAGFIIHIDEKSGTFTDIIGSNIITQQVILQDIVSPTTQDWYSWIDRLNRNPIQYLSNIQQKGHAPGDWTGLCARLNYNSLGVVRLSLNDAIWGIIALLYEDFDHPFSESDSQMLSSFQRTLEMLLLRNADMENLKAERDKAIAAEKAKSLFFATISHDIRTPLNSIVGFADLLYHGVKDEATVKTYLQNIQNSSNALKGLVSDVLDLSKLEVGSLNFAFEPTFFKDFADEVAATVVNSISQKGLEFKKSYESINVVTIDRNRVRQVLGNLLTNAVKFTEKGFISFTASFQYKTETTGTLLISIGDSGIGIAPEDIKTIMQPFAQVKGMYEGGGAGLGLAICKQMLDKMNGELKITSKLGEGSVFTVVLNDVTADSKPAEQHKTAVTFTLPANIAAWNILCVDDSPVNLSVLKALLIKAGIPKVTTVKSGEEAIKTMANTRFDLVLTDMWMPGMSGLQLVEYIRQDQRFAQLPVYVVTADVDTLKTYQNQQFTGILLKPLNLENIKTLLASLI